MTSRSAPVIAALAFLTLGLAACESGRGTGDCGRPAMAGGGGPSSAATGGASASGGAGGADGLRHGPFKMLALGTCLEYKHDSIPTGLALLSTLGKRTDGELPPGAQPGSQFTVTVAKDDLSDFTDATLANYEMIFFVSPTGTVFSSGGANGKIGMAAVQKFMENGGAWAGVHAATDFEKTGQWPWYQDQLAGGFFDHHDNDGTPGTLVWSTDATAADHPIVRGIDAPWSCSDEWYFLNRDVGNVPGFVVLGRLEADQRPAVWIHELTGGGRAFYTIRGHNKTAYAEPNFVQLVHQGILWAVHRMK